MSFQRSSFQNRQPGVLASGAIGIATGLLVVGGIVLLTQLPASAQQAANPAYSQSGDFERPFGFSYGQEAQGFDANTRDANGNRLILDGRIMTGMDASTFSTATASASSWSQAISGAGFGGASVQNQAIGNQLNVITNGSYNTVIVNSTQTNNGNQTATSNGSLNGKIDLND
ncbi:MAG TPA: holdfast anchoring protein HfaA [Hyphomonadaceae bacterium]|jgi:holdfast attachment protein HfaA|nr:holdfast anchoring protein HfaA [Hyphomonadaceae bacterium]